VFLNNSPWVFILALIVFSQRATSVHKYLPTYVEAWSCLLACERIESGQRTVDNNNNNNNSNNNTEDNVYSAVIMTKSFREFTRFI